MSGQRREQDRDAIARNALGQAWLLGYVAGNARIRRLVTLVFVVGIILGAVVVKALP